MEKVSLLFTRWLGNIPLEGRCSSCLFKARFRIVAAARPDKDDCQAQLERAFARHLEDCHIHEHAGAKARKRKAIGAGHGE
jgi:hypothetical protein